MDLKTNVSTSDQFPAGYLFYILFSVILGIEFISSQRDVFVAAGHDSWISVLLAYGFVFIVIAAMFWILRQYNGMDIIGIQVDLFGPFLAKVLTLFYIAYFASYPFSIILIYVEIVRVFIFPEMSPFVIGLLIMIIVSYSLFGGMKVILGTIFLFFIFSTPFFLFLLGKPLTQIDYHHFMPVFYASFEELGHGALEMIFPLMGFEIIFFIYPFIQKKEKAFQFSFFGYSFAVLIYFITQLISIGFFSEAQLERRIWPLFVLFKLQSLPFFERLDYIIIAELMLVMLPQIILLIWALAYSVKRAFKIPEKMTIYTYFILVLIFVIYTSEFTIINKFINTIETYGVWLIYIYPLILLPIVFIKKRLNKRKQGSESN